MTLAAALEIAEAKSESVALAQTAIARNEGDFVRAKSGRRPQLSGSATYDRSLANEFQGVFDDIDFGGGGSDGSGSLRGPAVRAREHVAGHALLLPDPVFGRAARRPGRSGLGWPARRRTGPVGARAQLLFDVTQAYYDAALSDRLVAIAEATLDQADATLRQAQAGFDAGTQPEFEVLRARVSRDNQLPLVIRQRVNRDVALLRLKQLLELPADADLRLADALGDERLGRRRRSRRRWRRSKAASRRATPRRSRCSRTHRCPTATPSPRRKRRSRRVKPRSLPLRPSAAPASA